MPKMTHPDHDRPLSVLAEDVEARTASGWSLVDAPAAAKAPPKKRAAKKAVTRKSVGKKS